MVCGAVATGTLIVRAEAVLPPAARFVVTVFGDGGGDASVAGDPSASGRVDDDCVPSTVPVAATGVALAGTIAASSFINSSAKSVGAGNGLPIGGAAVIGV